MNCIFICIFNNPNYVNMLYLLLDSIYTYGSLKDGCTEIVVYTSTRFMNMILKSPFYKEFVRFEINDKYTNVDKACKARLDLFDLPIIQKYSKILYLDTDIIVKGDLNVVFDLCTQDILYVLEEGFILSDTDFWGKSLFLTAGDLHVYDKNTSAFTSGILLFNNCNKIRDLFSNIKNDIIARPHQFYCHDQPYIIYNAFKYGLYDNQLLKEYVVNNDHSVNSNKIIHHFPGDPGLHQHKIKHMFTFLDGLKKLNT